MKLIRLHIENFGILSNYDFDFQNGLNMIKEENGFGKTTLGSFIKVMFFGFENEASKIKAKKERLKYMPWQGGVYGGNICFEHNGKTYEIYRTFKEDKKDDTFDLIDANTKLASDDFKSDTIGETIFGINGESFTRTLFISQNNYSYGTFTDIDAKIGNLVDATDDLNNYDTATKKLKNLLDNISAGRSGKLKEIENEIEALNKKVLMESGIKKSLVEYEDRLKSYGQDLEDLKKKKIEIQEELEKAAEIKDKQNYKNTYISLLDTYNKEFQNYNKQISYFPNDIPNKEELDSLIEVAKELNLFQTKMNENCLLDDEYSRLYSLNNKYSEIDINSDEIKEAKDKINEIRDKEDYIQKNDLNLEELNIFEKEKELFENVSFSKEKNDEVIRLWNFDRDEHIKIININNLSNEEERELEKLSSIYANDFVDIEKVNNSLKSWTGEREELKKELQGHELSNLEKEQLKKGSKIFDNNPVDLNKNAYFLELCNKRKQLETVIYAKENEKNNIHSTSTSLFKNILFIFGILIIIVSFVLFLMMPNEKIISLIILVVGIMLSIVGVILTNKKQKDEFLKEKSRIEGFINSNKKELSQIENDINTYLENYNIYCEKEKMEYALHRLIDEYNKYIELKHQDELNYKDNKDAKERISQIEANVREILSKYGFDYFEPNVAINLNEIINNYKRYISLKEIKNEYEIKAKKAREKIQDIDSSISAYLSQYGYSFNEKEVAIYLADINHRYDNYVKLANKKNDVALNNCKKDYELLKVSLDNFFAKYLKERVSVNDYLEKYSDLVQDLKIMIDLMETSKKYNEAKTQFEECKQKIYGFIDRYGFKRGQDFDKQLDEIKSHVISYEIIKKTYMDSKGKKDIFEREYPDYKELLLFKEEIDDNRLSKLASQNNKIVNEINLKEKQWNDCDKTLNELNDNFNEISDCKVKIQELKEEQKIYKKKRSILEKTIGHLKDSKDQLNAKYSKPLESALKEYFNDLFTNSDISIDVDAQRKLIIKSKGAIRSEDSLSAGYKDLIDLCYRLALAKAMYPNESLFVVLDDPFTNLDEEKIENGLKLIKKISERYQVLYLTCHNSRLL